MLFVDASQHDVVKPRDDIGHLIGSVIVHDHPPNILAGPDAHDLPARRVEQCVADQLTGSQSRTVDDHWTARQSFFQSGYRALDHQSASGDEAALEVVEV